MMSAKPSWFRSPAVLTAEPNSSETFAAVSDSRIWPWAGAEAATRSATNAHTNAPSRRLLAGEVRMSVALSSPQGDRDSIAVYYEQGRRTARTMRYAPRALHKPMLTSDYEPTQVTPGFQESRMPWAARLAASAVSSRPAPSSSDMPLITSSRASDVDPSFKTCRATAAASDDDANASAPSTGFVRAKGFCAASRSTFLVSGAFGALAPTWKTSMRI